MVKSFRSPGSYRAVLISISIAIRQNQLVDIDVIAGYTDMVSGFGTFRKMGRLLSVFSASFPSHPSFLSFLSPS